MTAEEKWRQRKDFSSPLQLRWLYTFFLSKKKNEKKNFPVCTSECLPARRSAGDHA